MALLDAKGTPAVSRVQHRQPATVTSPTVTSPTFTNTSTGTLGGWFKTILSGRAQNRVDTAEVYSNVEAPTREDIRDHSLGSTLTFDENGRPTDHIDVTEAHGPIAASSRFPRASTQSSGEVETFTVTDRGLHRTQDEKDMAVMTAQDTATTQCATAGDACDMARAALAEARSERVRGARYPERYSVDVPGTLMGAPGNFRCANLTEEGAECEVDRSGPNNYDFSADSGTEWQFIPTSATSKVIIPDGEYMWFGWWTRAPQESEPNAVHAVFDFGVNYGGMGAVTTVAGAIGPARYEGSAVGQYAVYDVVAAENDRSRSGRFEATAILTADFADGTTTGNALRFDHGFRHRTRLVTDVEVGNAFRIRRCVGWRCFVVDPWHLARRWGVGIAVLLERQRAE